MPDPLLGRCRPEDYPRLEDCKRSRCGLIVYFGSRADWMPALTTDQRRQSSPAHTSAPPSAAAFLLFPPRVASSAAPEPARAFAAHESLPAVPRRYTSPTSPSRSSMPCMSEPSAATAPIASRRAGPASAGSRKMHAAAPALAAALAPK